MEQETFQASVQYEDFYGSVAADRADRESIEDWLSIRELRQSGELVCGISLSIGENHGDELVNPVQISIYLVAGETIDSLRERILTGSAPLAVRRVDTVMTFPEFLSFFKRLNLTLSPTSYGVRQGLLEGVDLLYEL
jgi:hypothetical protein